MIGLGQTVELYGAAVWRTVKTDRMDVDKALNARQVKVLGWIADGCPDGVMDGHAHKSSAVALQSRRLVKISQHRGVWATETTDAGRTYLQTGSTRRGDRHRR